MCESRDTSVIKSVFYGLMSDRILYMVLVFDSFMFPLVTFSICTISSIYKYFPLLPFPTCHRCEPVLPSKRFEMRAEDFFDT